MNGENSLTGLYPRTTDKIRRRLCDLPQQLSQARDALFPGDFARFYEVVLPFTMLSNARLRGLYRAVRHVEAHSIEGDAVECGTARGGSAALMGLTLKRLKANRTLWVFDTFEGLPAPTIADPDYETASHYTGACRGELREVEDLFQQLEIRKETRFVKGLFQDTLFACDIPKIAVLHIDGDWYDSVKTCLLHLYDRVSEGGIIQIDDYGQWAGARKAVDEFMRERHIKAPLRYLDYTGRQLIKPLVKESVGGKPSATGR